VSFGSHRRSLRARPLCRSKTGCGYVGSLQIRNTHSRSRSDQRNILRNKKFFLAICQKCFTLPKMLQRNEENMAPVLEVRRNGTSHKEDRDALLEAKDETIAELKAQVAFLRDELRSKNAILLRVTESIGELPARMSEATDGPRKVTPRGTTRVGAPGSDDPQGLEKPEKPKLPEGYRVVAVASDAWVLVAPGGSRVAGYRGELDLWRATLDAREHHQSAE
jgi:hypothetical protein